MNDFMKNCSKWFTFFLTFTFYGIIFPQAVDAGLFAKRLAKKHYAVRSALFLGPETSLLQENSLEGWTTIGGKTPPSAWRISEGTLHLKGKGGDIISDRDYENYILDFVWTISKGGNSGIKYRFKRFDGKGWLGPEYQVLDDFNTGEGKKPKNSTATLYDIKAANAEKRLNPHTEKNYGRIVVCGDKLEHWLNGKKVVEIVVGSEEWKQLISQSKFRDIHGFGENNLGRIMLQDHQCEVFFHKISIREIVEAKIRVKTTPTMRPDRKHGFLKKLKWKSSRRAGSCFKTTRFKSIR